MGLRIGLLGASRIAPRAVIGPASRRSDVEVTVVAARDPEKARAFAVEYGVASVADSYDALIARDDVDLVYCALPPAAHLEPCLAALALGKALLIEKPFAMSAGQAASIALAADRAGRPALEAFHYRFHSQTVRALELIGAGALGDLTAVRGVFEATIPQRPGELRWKPELGGGGVMDLGCYVVHALRTLLGSEPRVGRVQAELRSGVDASLDAALAFSGVEGALRCSMVAPRRDGLVLTGSEGELTLTNFVAPQSGGLLTLRTPKGAREETASGPSSYDAQLDHAVRVVAGEAEPLTGGTDAVNTMKVLDALRDAAGVDRTV